MSPDPGPLRHTDALATQISESVIHCTLCPRLRAHCAEVARTKRKAYQAETYWGKPVPGFGDSHARVWIVGLAPGAHGANRTGRVFTGDRSGEWLYKVLHQYGMSSHPHSTHASDALSLKDTYISCVARCAPPDNKPTREEIESCAPFLKDEWKLLTRVEVIVALGGVAWENILKLETWGDTAKNQRKAQKFGHGATLRLTHEGRSLTLLGSYHPSQQNTFTGRLTWPMWEEIFQKTMKLLTHTAD